MFAEVKVEEETELCSLSYGTIDDGRSVMNTLDLAVHIPSSRSIVNSSPEQLHKFDTGT